VAGSVTFLPFPRGLPNGRTDQNWTFGFCCDGIADEEMLPIAFNPGSDKDLT